MGHGTRSFALALLLAGSASTAEAAAWRVEGFYRFVLQPTYLDTGEPLGFLGDSVLYYSAEITTEDFTDQTVDSDLEQFVLQSGVSGFDSVNEGPWTPLTGPALVFLYTPYYLDPIPPDPDPNFLMPIGGYTLDSGGQFAWWRDSNAHSAFFRYNGDFWQCDSDGIVGCVGVQDGVLTYLSFGAGYFGEGTVERIPEPTFVALLSLGLAGLGLSRKKKVLHPFPGKAARILRKK